MPTCPRDSRNLALQHDGSRQIWRCNFCSGALINGFPKETVLQPGGIATREDWDPDINCPMDGTRMSLFHWRGGAIDVCSQCNMVWFDPDEMELFLGPVMEEDPSASGPVSNFSVSDPIENVLSAAKILDDFLDDLFNGR
jgi:Zn-finger nucleic acid-binding protein